MRNSLIQQRINRSQDYTSNRKSSRFNLLKNNSLKENFGESEAPPHEILGTTGNLVLKNIQRRQKGGRIGKRAREMKFSEIL